jgi:hypothetical protein
MAGTQPVRQVRRVCAAKKPNEPAPLQKDGLIVDGRLSIITSVPVPSCHARR